MWKQSENEPYEVTSNYSLKNVLLKRTQYKKMKFYLLFIEILAFVSTLHMHRQGPLKGPQH